MSKNFFGKEKDISKFIRYQLKIATHQGGIVWRVIQYAKIYRVYYKIPGTPVSTSIVYGVLLLTKCVHIAGNSACGMLRFCTLKSMGKYHYLPVRRRRQDTVLKLPFFHVHHTWLHIDCILIGFMFIMFT